MIKNNTFIKKSISKQVQPSKINMNIIERRKPSQSPTYRQLNKTTKVEPKDEKCAVFKKDKSRSKSRTYKDLQQNNENLNPNIKNQSNMAKPKVKGRTVKDVRINNTRGRVKTGKQNTLVDTRCKVQLRDRKRQQIGQQTKLDNQLWAVSIVSVSELSSVTKIQQLLDISDDAQSILRYIPPMLMSKRVSFSDFQVLRTILSQNYFTQYLVAHYQLKALFTLRVISKQAVATQELQHQLIEAITIHTYLSNYHVPHLQTLYYTFDDACSIYLVMEPTISQLSLLQQTNREKGLPENILRIITKSYLQTLSILHSHRILIRKIDLSCMTIYNKLLKIGFLEGAASLQTRCLRDSFLGKVEDIAHQLSQGHSYDYGYDLWSLGILLYRAAIGRQPFSGSNILSQIQQLEYDIPLHLSQELCNLISRLLTERENRLTVEEALSHAFIKRSDEGTVMRDIWLFCQP